MTIAVVGAGAIGATFAAQLWKSGQRELLFCVRRPVASWSVETGAGAIVMTPGVAVDAASVRPVDFVLLATKAHQTPGAAAWLRALAGPQTCVAVLQNGIDHTERVRPYIHGGASLVPAVVQCPAEQLELGRIVQRGPAGLVLPDTPDARRFGALFAQSDATMEHRQDFQTALWEKLCWNLVGALMAITCEPLGVMRAPDLADLARGLLHEAVAVARADGATLADDFADDVVTKYQSADPTRGTSILYDRRAGRPLEYEARNEVVVVRGARHGIAVPLNAAIVALLRAISDGAAGA
ncbi:MAG: 2-dehydropantoate 2-reductase [Myxococcaceae bacterium]|nr:2-dehydropantoate 2-reductase [Myxococcaceae bacterium]